MKRLTLIAFLIWIGLSCFAQKTELINDCQILILKTFFYEDLNPIYQHETDSINQEFEKALLNRDISHFDNNYKTDIEPIFKRIFDNSTSEYDDSPDYRRQKMRRSICFATIALLTKIDKAYTFIEYSKVSLIESIDRPDDELLENEYLGLMILELMMKIEDNKLIKSDIEKLDKYLTLKKDLILEQNYLDSQKIINNSKLIIK
jgi:hypothetical protein